MSQWIPSFLREHVLPVIAGGITACKNRVSEICQKVLPFQNGTLYPQAKEGVKEIALGVTAQAIGINLGTYFPQGAMAAGIVIKVGQLAYQTFKNPPPDNTGEVDDDDEVFFDALEHDPPEEIDMNGWIAGLTAATTTALFFYYFSSVDLVALNPQALQYLLTLFGTAAGGFVGLFLVGKDPTDPKSPWHDGYIGRNMRYIGVQNAVALIGHHIPTLTTIANATKHLLPAPLDSLLPLQAYLTDTYLSIIFQNAAAYAAYYSVPLSKVVYRAIYFTPPRSDYEHLDPSLLIKAIINTTHGNPYSFVAEQLAKLPIGAALKQLIAHLVATGIQQDLIVNLIVRSVNGYSELIQDRYIQIAMKQLSDATAAENQLRAQLAKKPYAKAAEEKLSQAIADDQMKRRLEENPKTQAAMQKLSASVTPQNIHGKIKDLLKYRDLLKNDNEFKQKFADILSKDEKTHYQELNNLVKNNGCTDIIIELSKKTSAPLQMVEKIQLLLSQLESQLKVFSKQEKLNRFLHSGALKSEQIVKKKNDLEQYLDRLTNDANFMNQFADIVTEETDKKTQLEQLNKIVPSNTCSDVILEFYNSTQSLNGVREEITLLLAHLKSQLNVLSKKEKLHEFLYAEMKKVEVQELTENLDLPPVAQAAIEMALSAVENQETILLGGPLTNKSLNQALVEVHGQGFLVFFLNKLDKLMKTKENPDLTKTDIRKFYLNLNNLAWAPLPQAIPQFLQTVVARVVPPLVEHAEPLHRILAGMSIPDYHDVKIEEIPNELFESQEPTPKPVSTDPKERILDEALQDFNTLQKNQPKPAPIDLKPFKHIVSPAKLARMAIKTTYGNPLAFAETIVKMPLFQGIMNRLIVGTIDSDILVKALVRSVNLYATVLKDPAVQQAMKELGTSIPATKNEKKKALNHAIYEAIFKSMTVSVGEKWFAYGTKSTIAKRLAPLIQKLVSTLKESPVGHQIDPLLNELYDEASLEACLRGFIILTALITRKAMFYERKNLKLEETEINHFYSNFVNIVFAPFAHPVAGALKGISETGLPLLLNEGILKSPAFTKILNELSNVDMSEFTDEEVENRSPSAEPEKDKPFDPIRKIQKIWYMFIAVLSYGVDTLKWSFEQLTRPCTPKVAKIPRPKPIEPATPPLKKPNFTPTPLPRLPSSAPTPYDSKAPFTLSPKKKSRYPHLTNPEPIRGKRKNGETFHSDSLHS